MKKGKRSKKPTPPISSSTSACLVQGSALHHIDHLAVIAYLMDIPVITEEEALLPITEKYYPQIKNVQVIDNIHFLKFLSDHYDTLFISANYRLKLSPMLETFFNKKMKFWYCPHGNSDKQMEQIRSQHRLLIYGDQMEERFTSLDMLSHLDHYVRTGNYRLHFYQEHQAFYDQIVEEEIFSTFQKRQKTILYAPTWEDLEKSTSVFESALPVIENLPSNYNLVVKLHPNLEHYNPGYVNLIREKYQDRKNIVFLSFYPLVFPILNRTDIYLGDFSSVGYDFLYFKKPMFFFEAKNRETKSIPSSSYLHQCGTVIPTSEYNNIYPFIEKNLEVKENTLFEHAFDQTIDLNLLRENLSKIETPSLRKFEGSF